MRQDEIIMRLRRLLKYLSMLKSIDWKPRTEREVCHCQRLSDSLKRKAAIGYSYTVRSSH